MFELKIKIDSEQDLETLKITKKIVINPNYHDLTVNDRLELLNMIVEWSTTELKKTIEINNKKISTKTRCKL
jgi:hypothetical protein